MAIVKLVPGFKPSTSGFHFANSFPSVPLLTLDVLGLQIPIGDAANGLCGGMVFAVRDYFEAGLGMWADTTAPSSGQLFDYIVRRLFDSFDLILPPPPLPPPFITPTPPFGPGPVTYMWLMDPALPDHETVVSNTGLAPRGRAWIMINDQWPKIMADIDNGRLSPLGLIRTKSLDPTQMGQNHQVLAYGYRLDGTNLDIFVYDPNYPDNDTVKISLSIADPQHTTPVTYSTGEDLWCFFSPAYSFASPPPPPAPTPKCFIATAACGADSIEVSILRSFRDQRLLATRLGRVTVTLYEKLSPPLAAVISRSPALRAITRKLIVAPACLIVDRLTSRISRRRG